MKFNTTYTQKIKLKETLVAINKINGELSSYMKKNFDVITVNAPMFSEEGADDNLAIPELTRKVSFDTINDYSLGSFYISHSLWSREFIEKLDLKFGKGIVFTAETLWRDIVQRPSSGIVKRELSVLIKVKPDSIEELINETTKDIYKLFFDIATKVGNLFNIENTFPENPQWITPQDLENELPNENVKEREMSFVSNANAFIFKTPGKRMFSGKIHSNISPVIYDLQYFNQIVLKDFINVDAIKVASVSLLATGKKLSDQLRMYNKEESANLELVNHHEKINDRRYLEIKINLPRLYMSLLKKGHISEVQPDVHTAESILIKENYKVETY